MLYIFSDLIFSNHTNKKATRKKKSFYSGFHSSKLSWASIKPEIGSLPVHGHIVSKQVKVNQHISVPGFWNPRENLTLCKHYTNRVACLPQVALVTHKGSHLIFHSLLLRIFLVSFYKK